MIFTSPVSARSNPLISCICVTKRNLEEIEGSVGCFMAQTYENRELIVLHDGGNREVEEFILAANSCSPDINLFYYECHSDKGMSLGELRNKSIGLCSGDYVCQWDDDDWMHRRRLAGLNTLGIALYSFVYFGGNEDDYDTPIIAVTSE